MHSEDIKDLAVTLVAAQAEFSAVPKGSTNPFFKSKYAALPDVVATAGPVLAKHGLAVSQFISEDDSLTTYLLHVSGQFISHTMTLHLVKNDPQAQGSAVTYARRYSYMSCLGLVADEDDDGNKASQNPTSEATGGQTGEQRPSTALSTLQTEIKENPAYKKLPTEQKATMLSDAVGYEVKSLRDLSNDDCEQVLARLKAL